MTQEQLAEKLFVSRAAISKWESGKGYPNIDSLKNISKVFSVSIDALFFILPITMFLMGIAELFIQHLENEKWLNLSKNCSIFFMIKVVLLMENSKLK